MSVRTYDPKPPELFGSACCTEPQCGKPYYSICALCNLAYCFEHLKQAPHACNTRMPFLVLSEDEVADLFGEPTHEA